MIHTFTYDGKNSYTDFGITVESLSIGPPVPRRTEVTIPFRSSAIDVDEIMGYPTFDDRTVTIKIWKRCGKREAVKRCSDEINRWFLGEAGKRELVDSDEKDYVYHAYPTQTDFSESTALFMRGTITMKASPYKVHKTTGKEVI